MQCWQIHNAQQSLAKRSEASTKRGKRPRPEEWQSGRGRGEQSSKDRAPGDPSAAAFPFECGGQYEVDDGAKAGLGGQQVSAQSTREFWAAKKAESMRQRQQGGQEEKGLSDEAKTKLAQKQKKLLKKEEKRRKKERKKKEKREKKRAKKEKKKQRRKERHKAGSGSGSGSERSSGSESEPGG